jgi:plastocyanin
MRTHTTTNRTRLVRGFALGAVLTGLFATSVSAATTQVGVGNGSKTFSPSAVTQAVGGSVQWAATDGDTHSVTQNALIFDSGPASVGVNFTKTFSAGTFPYHCKKHGDQGMVGTVRVPPQVLASPTGLPFTVTWASAATNTGTRFDVQYRVGTGAFKTWVRGTTAKSKVFGARSNPVRVARGKTYAFRVVSKTAAGSSAQSPAKSFRVR